jgi:hypothetical protein
MMYEPNMFTLHSRIACQPPLRDAPDTNPAVGYFSMGEGCRLLNGAGLLVYISSFLGSLAIANLPVNGGNTLSAPTADDQLNRTTFLTTKLMN